MLGAVPDFTVQLFEESLAALAVLFVVPNHLQVPLGGNVELVFDLLGVYVVIARDGWPPAEASLRASLAASVLPTYR